MQVFMVQGSLIGIIGTVLGVVGGILLTLNLDQHPAGHRALGVQLMPEDVYYITGLPTDLQASDVTHRLRGAGDGLPGHPVSGLARGAHRTGGGAAL
jgi:ABC-type lipoprotein release transport system permease subunit